jgi:hypothetical protein
MLAMLNKAVTLGLSGRGSLTVLALS